eukprot:4884326-Prymnesium_polylepis.2
MPCISICSRADVRNAKRCGCGVKLANSCCASAGRLALHAIYSADAAGHRGVRHGGSASGGCAAWGTAKGWISVVVVPGGYCSARTAHVRRRDVDHNQRAEGVGSRRALGALGT